MSDFEEALRKTVLGVEQGFKQALSDLSEETSSASESVTRVTNGTAHLFLRPFAQSGEGSSFELYVVDRTNLSDIAAFFFSPGGYPIRVASSIGSGKVGLWEEVINDRTGITKYFSDLATDPDSRLVLRLAFLLRKLGQEQKVDSES